MKRIILISTGCAMCALAFVLWETDGVVACFDSGYPGQASIAAGSPLFLSTLGRATEDLTFGRTPQDPTNRRPIRKLYDPVRFSTISGPTCDSPCVTWDVTCTYCGQCATVDPGGPWCLRNEWGRHSMNLAGALTLMHWREGRRCISKLVHWCKPHGIREGGPSNETPYHSSNVGCLCRPLCSWQWVNDAPSRISRDRSRDDMVRGTAQRHLEQDDFAEAGWQRFLRLDQRSG